MAPIHVRLARAIVLLMFVLSWFWCGAATASNGMNPSYLDLRPGIYGWESRTNKPQAIVLAIHGMTLHAGTFDRMARELAKHNVLTVAPDLRGFGSCYANFRTDPHTARVNYRLSKADLIAILQSLNRRYEGVPVYVIGESLGANLALWLASTRPDLVTGLVLSSPCVKRYLNLSPCMARDLAVGIVLPGKQVSLTPYVDKYLTHEANILDHYKSDPLIRKTMSLVELLKSVHANRTALRKATSIEPQIPILMIEGTLDRLYSSASAVQLFHKLKSRDRRLYLAREQGHLLLETPAMNAGVLEAITQWISEQSARRSQPTGNLATIPKVE